MSFSRAEIEEEIRKYHDWENCVHVFGVISSDEKVAQVACTKCSFAYNAKLDDTKNLPNWWTLMGQTSGVVEMNELCRLAEKIADDAANGKL